MRITALYLAILLMAAALVPRRWASADMSADPISHESWRRAQTTGVEVGLRDFYSYYASQSRIEPLRELNGVGLGFEHKGLAAFYAGVAAALACAAASELVRRRRLSIALKIVLVLPMVASLVTAFIFMGALGTFGYLSLGWSVLANIAGVAIGVAAIVVPVTGGASRST